MVDYSFVSVDRELDPNFSRRERIAWYKLKKRIKKLVLKMCKCKNKISKKGKK